MKFLFAAGGTAGHINPALAVASYLKQNYPDSEILFAGTGDHMESRLVPSAGFDFKTIEISGFRRSVSPKATAHNIKTVFQILKSSAQSKKIIKEFNPDVAVGFGGYVSGPVLQSAVKLGIPSCIHEQNAFPGVTNKALAKEVNAVMLTSEDAKKHLEIKNECYITGLPVRGEILTADKYKSRIELGIESDIPLVVSFGGSLGAKPINDAMEKVLIAHSKDNKCMHIHSTGKNGSYMLDNLKSKGFDFSNKNIDIREYIDNMDVCLSAADLVIGRAGASSLSEIEALGKPSVLIPSPYVAENHQFHNAMSLVNRGAAIIIEEKELTGEKLLETIDKLLSDKEKLKEMGKNAKTLAMSNSTEKISEIILNTAKSH